MRGLLLFNPNATTTDDGTRDVITSALSSVVHLEVHATKQRGHATHIAAGAVHEDVDIVFALGGDGTANEVIQAVAGTSVTLGVIPGGGANVLARVLGLPNDAVAATSVLLEHVRHNRRRRIGLGKANGRYFAFNAGFGYDAAVVRRVEQSARLRRWLGQGSFLWSATREWLTGPDRSDPTITLSRPDAPSSGAYLVTIIGNTDPYTFLGSRSFHMTPQASFDTGLDVMALRRPSTAGLLRMVADGFRHGAHLNRPQVDHFHDLSEFVLTAQRPSPLMVDGDYAGEHRRVEFSAVPSALTLLA